MRVLSFCNRNLLVLQHIKYLTLPYVFIFSYSPAICQINDQISSLLHCICSINHIDSAIGIDISIPDTKKRINIFDALPDMIFF